MVRRPCPVRVDVTAGVVRAGEASPEKVASQADDAEKLLFVWAGDQSRSNPDFLAVVNFDDHSSSYGAVINRVPLSGAGATGNEPHHVGISSDGKVLAAGGLLSVLKGQPEIFFFDISNPVATRFVASVDAPNSSITDEFEPLDSGGFLVTMMGGANGHSPGRVVEFDRDLKIVDWSGYPCFASKRVPALGRCRNDAMSPGHEL